jgi:hypothetical protein
MRRINSDARQALQRLQAFYRREQHWKADRETPESRIARVCGQSCRLGSNYVSNGKSGVQLSAFRPTIVSGNKGVAAHASFECGV